MAPIKIYLDTSVYNRPFDDQTQPRIWLETLAFSLVLQMIEGDQVLLVTSSVLAYENSRNPSRMRRKWVQHCSALASAHQEVNVSIGRRAQVLEKQGVKAPDALHVACAEAADCEYFLTCDDRLLRHYQSPKVAPELRALNPVDFIVEVGGEVVWQ
jgi:predicted nucleic acid-binding protein